MSGTGVSRHRTPLVTPTARRAISLPLDRGQLRTRSRRDGTLHDVSKEQHTPSSILPPSRSSPAELVERAVLREAGRGERLVAWARALLTSASVVLLTVILGLPALRGVPDSRGRGLVPILMLPSLLFAWAWLAFVSKRPFERWMGRVSTVVDVSFLGAFLLVELQLRGSPVAEAIALASLPPLMALMFVTVAASLRHDPAASVIGGCLAFVLVGIALFRARALMQPGLLPESLAFETTNGPWTGRAMIFAVTVATMAIAARNARRMAEATAIAVAEQDKITQLFGRYVDPRIAREVMDREGRAAELLEVTVLFTDLRDFTSLSESLAPDAVLEALNEHYETIVPVVHRHGGTVNKFIGDAIMATFGAPIRTKDHASRAVAAAVEMLAATDALNDRNRRVGHAEFRMGVGIATGTVVVGTLGAAERVEYAVIGDTVNIASRLEGLCKQFGVRVVLAGTTRSAIGDLVPTRSLGDTAVKGKAQTLEVFTVNV